MFHPRNRKPLDLDIQYNVKENKYETVENGLLYAIPFALLDRFKNHYKYNHSVGEWYSQLNRTEKKQVIILGKPDNSFNYTDGDFIE